MVVACLVKSFPYSLSPIITILSKVGGMTFGIWEGGKTRSLGDEVSQKLKNFER